jgi:N-dimethylarginine dimethylaminohydrolase
MPRVLMCRPDYYGVRYEINPWMRVGRDADPKRAQAQWQELHDTLERRLRVQVELIDADEHWPDMVFTANAGLVVGRKYVASNFRHAQRSGEACLFWKWFADRRYTCISLPLDRCFEGEGDALWAGDGPGAGAAGTPARGPGLAQEAPPGAGGERDCPTLVAGYHFRSDLGGDELLADVIRCRVIGVELRQERFYHLDTCLAPLGPTAAIWHPPAFDDYARQAIRDLFPDLIELDSAEAMRFAANAVVVGRGVVLNAGCPRLSAELERRGYEVFSVDLSEFMKAGGAAKCLVLWLER